MFLLIFLFVCLLVDDLLWVSGFCLLPVTDLTYDETAINKMLRWAGGGRGLLLGSNKWGERMGFL